MKKLSLLFAIGFTMVGSSMAQMVIPGETFAANPARFNNRPTTIKNIEIVQENATGGPSIGGPAGSTPSFAPPAGSPSAPNNTPCRPPRGFSQVNLNFKGAPEFNACFFMSDVMKAQMDRECGKKNSPATISFRGESRVGYNITAYKLGL